MELRESALSAGLRHPSVPRQLAGSRFGARSLSDDIDMYRKQRFSMHVKADMHSALRLSWQSGRT
jgi:hypothetical protein